MRRRNQPTPIAVRAGPDGSPLAVRRGAWRAPCPVARILDRWRIDDEWWRERPIPRLNRELLPDDGMRLLVYPDLIDGAWFEQPGG